MSSFFACIDISQPFVAWATYRGVLVAASRVREYPNCAISLMLAGMLKHKNSIRLNNELAIERIRQKRYSNKISRLVGMYLFESRKALEKACEWGGDHFKKEYMAEIGILSGSIYSRHDSNWITYAPVDDRSGLLKSINWCEQYWSGEPYPDKEPVWEIILDGRAVVNGTDLRNSAYIKIKSEFPECLSILEVGRIAATLNSNLGQIFAWLQHSSEKTLSLCYYLDMEDAKNPEFLKRIKNYKGGKNYEDLAIGGDKFTVPDFQKFGETLTTNDSITKEFFNKIHSN